MDFFTTVRALKIPGSYEKAFLLKYFVDKPIQHTIVRIAVIIVVYFIVFVIPMLVNQYFTIIVNIFVAFLSIILFIWNYYLVKFQINNIEIIRSNKKE
jgi:hypothetical protein